MSAAADSARAKLTARELDALRVELRREARAELAEAKRQRKLSRVSYVETPKVVEAAQRMVAAVGVRAAIDVDALPLLQQLHADVDAALQAGVDGLRASGYSWADVADRLGVKRQSAAERFTRRATA